MGLVGIWKSLVHSCYQNCHSEGSGINSVCLIMSLTEGSFVLLIKIQRFAQVHLQVPVMPLASARFAVCSFPPVPRVTPSPGFTLCSHTSPAATETALLMAPVTSSKFLFLWFGVSSVTVYRWSSLLDS